MKNTKQLELLSILIKSGLTSDDAHEIAGDIIENMDVVDKSAIPHYRDMLFSALELLRKEAALSFAADADWKDVDDYVFSKLDFTCSELEEIYEGRGVMVYAASAASNGGKT